MVGTNARRHEPLRVARAAAVARGPGWVRRAIRAGAARGEVHGIGLQNMGVGSFARELAEEIVRNVQSLLPADIQRGRTRLVGSGNALRKKALRRRAVREVVFGYPLRLTPFQEKAEVGAAKLARDAKQSFTLEATSQGLGAKILSSARAYFWIKFRRCRAAVRIARCRPSSVRPKESSSTSMHTGPS